MGCYPTCVVRGWGVLDSAAWSITVASSKSRVIASAPDKDGRWGGSAGELRQAGDVAAGALMQVFRVAGQGARPVLVQAQRGF